jgi:hypothetical protein
LSLPRLRLGRRTCRFRREPRRFRRRLVTLGLRGKRARLLRRGFRA